MVRTGEDSLLHGYNGLDERVSTVRLPAGGGAAEQRRMVTGPDGRAMGEYGGSAVDVRAEYIWPMPEAGEAGLYGGDDGLGGYMPLALVTTGGVLSWVHGDHLGTPIVLTDATGTAIAQPAGYSVAAFPGQLKTLPDLYYNRYRDYDPTTGRYLQADPIGLDGGPNPYLYANANPVRYVDPDGRNPVAVGVFAVRLYCARLPLHCAGAAAAVGGAIYNLIGRVPGRTVGNACNEAIASDGPPPRLNCRKAGDEELRQLGVDAHDLKYDELGRGTKISRFDICICTIGSRRFLTLAPTDRCGRSRPEEHYYVNEI